MKFYQTILKELIMIKARIQTTNQFELDWKI